MRLPERRASCLARLDCALPLHRPFGRLSVTRQRSDDTDLAPSVRDLADDRTLALHWKMGRG
jgi:hypothetical protein